MPLNLGYCCINLTLQPSNISVNNGCVRKTFINKGLAYVSKLSLLNVNSLKEVITWNLINNITVYRMSSDMFPWQSEYEIKDLPDYDEISIILKDIGDFAVAHGIRLSFHPGPFNVLGSPNPDLVEKTIKELNQHAEIMDLMGLDRSHKYPINIHCNGVYGNKDATLNRWVTNFQMLSQSARSRLVVENDDKASMYSVKDLYDIIFKHIRVPITFDFHHHRFNDGGLSEREAFVLAYSTWEYHKIKPLFHYSSCRKTFENVEARAQAHADFIYETIHDYGYDIDIELECKAKEIALLKYRTTHEQLLTDYIPLNEYYGNAIA